MAVGGIHMQEIPLTCTSWHPFQTVKRRALRRDGSSITYPEWLGGIS